jgi:hypothetical protein
LITLKVTLNKVNNNLENWQSGLILENWQSGLIASWYRDNSIRY